MERKLRRGAAPVAAAAVLSLLPVLLQAQRASVHTGVPEADTASIVVMQPSQRHLWLEPRLAEFAVSQLDTTPLMQDLARDRNDAMLNGALIALGALGVFDNVVVHWILGWHRAIEDHPHTLEIEIGIVALSTALLATGLWREYRARRR